MVNEKSKEVYESESKKFTRYHHVSLMTGIGIVDYQHCYLALDIMLGGFTPIIWLVLAFRLILIIICTEVSMIRAFLESTKLI